MTAPMDTAREVATRRRDALAQMHDDWPPEAREAVARAMCAASRPAADPDKMTPAPRGTVGLVPLWSLYAHMADAALAALAPFVAQIEAAAFKRGAEAMREAFLARLATIQHVTPETWQAGVEAARVAARTLPIPEDKP